MKFNTNKMDVKTYNTKFIPQYETAICFIQNLQHTLEGKCDKESLRQLQIIGWNEETKKFISDALNLYVEKVVNELNLGDNYSSDNNISKENCPIYGKQSLSASNHYCRDHANSDDTNKYRVEYDGVVCTEVNWETKEFYFTFKGKEYKYKQQGDISCNADTDHIRCVIEEFKEDLMKKEENNMENYIVINGKKTELTKEQLKQLGIGIEKERNNPFNDMEEYRTEYYYIDAFGIEKTLFNDRKVDRDFICSVNCFNDKDFANQVYLHELLNRKLLKYAYDNEAEDCEWNNVKNHYRISKSSNNDFVVLKDIMYKTLGAVYFSTEEVALQATKDVVEPFIKAHSKFVW